MCRIGPAARTATRRLVLLLTASACAACGQTTATTTMTSGPAPRTSATLTPSASASASATATASGQATTTATASSLPGTGRPAITVGDKNYSEQFVLGQLYLQALVAQGFSVTLDENIGPTQVTIQGLQTGSLSMYPEYLTVFDQAIAGNEQAFRSQGDALAAGRRWAAAHGLTLLAPTPFSNTEGLAVSDAYSAANHLRTIGDLRRVAGALTIGGPSQFQSEAPGLSALDAAYGLVPAGFQTMAVGAQYAALNGDAVQAADVKTTDGQLATGDYAVLSDPHRVFGWGNVVPVVSTKVLLAEGPAFSATIARVDAALSTTVMRQLNEQVDIAQQDPTAVAKQFLQTHGLLTPLNAPAPSGP